MRTRARRRLLQPLPPRHGIVRRAGGIGLRHLSDRAIVGAFADCYREVTLDPDARALENLLQVAALEVGGATCAHLAVRHLLDSGRWVDRAILLTDCMLWSPRRCDANSVDEHLYALWQEYRRRVNPDAVAYVWNLQPYELFIEPARDRSMVTLSGWSEGLLRYIPLSEVEPGVQVREVDEVRL